MARRGGVGLNRKSIAIAALMLFVAALITTQFAVQWYQGHPSQETLRQDIITEEGFQVVSQQQNVSAHFKFEPSWIPMKNGTKKVIHDVFYHNHDTQIYVDSVERTMEGNVRVYIDSTTRYFRNGGTFVTSMVWNKQDNGAVELTTIPWSGLNHWSLNKISSPVFTNTSTNKTFTINEEAATGPLNELMFGIRAKDVSTYFSRPVTVSIPDFNLVSYAPN